jgi:hypothetical protein
LITIYFYFHQALVLISAGPQSAKVPGMHLRQASKKLYDNKVYVYGIGVGPSFNQMDVLRTAARGDFVYYKYKYAQMSKLAAPIAAALPKGMLVISDKTIPC